MSWVPRLFGAVSSWKNVPLVYMRDMGFSLESIVKTNSINLKHVFKNSKFYRDIFIAFNKCKDDTVIVHKRSVFSEVVWLNTHFLWKNDVIYFKTWLQSGFIYIKDFYDNNGDMLNERAIFNKLVNKKIWISEYMILRSTVIKTLKDIDTTYAAYNNNNKNNNKF